MTKCDFCRMYDPLKGKCSANIFNKRKNCDGAAKLFFRYMRSGSTRNININHK